MLQGIIPPLVTPLQARDTLDQTGLERLVEHVIAGGVSGLFVLGTTGEAPSLSYHLRRELITRVCDQTAARLPVLVGITDTAFVESVELARHAAQAGATAVVLSTPYYFPAGQTELIAYVRNLAAELPLPLVLYNMPSLTKVWFEIDTLKQLAELENVIGVKDSSGDLEYFARLAEVRLLRPDWFCFMGPENLLAEALQLGGQGGVHGGANVYPELFVGLYDALVSGDVPRQQHLQSIVDELQAIYAIGKYASRFIKATKCALSLRGICQDFLAEPFHHFHPPERARVAEILATVDRLIVGS
ncbi:dihydrodipicolinate synthase family protein [Planctomycetaceae bacterium SH139]